MTAKETLVNMAQYNLDASVSCMVDAIAGTSPSGLKPEDWHNRIRAEHAALQLAKSLPDEPVADGEVVTL